MQKNAVVLNVVIINQLISYNKRAAILMIYQFNNGYL